MLVRGMAMRTSLAAFLLVLFLAACVPPALPPARQGGVTAIASFGFLAPPVQAVVDNSAHVIRAEVPAGTDCSCLVAVFVTTGSRVTVGGVEQQSGVTPNDFTSPVAYLVEAADGSSVTYTVQVTVLPPLSPNKAITSFSIVKPTAEGMVDGVGHTVTVMVPYGTDRSSLVAAFSTTGVRVTVFDTEQESGKTINDFSETLAYLVTAEDGSSQEYAVTVLEAPSQEKALTSFGFLTPGCAVALDQAQQVIRARAPLGTTLTSMVAVFSTTGAKVRVAGRPQESGVTANDFSAPVLYEVVAEDGSTATYTVRVVDQIPVVINELDVDQVGTDTAEFVELYTSAEVDLWGVAVVLLNGGVTPGQEYARVELSPVGVVPRGTCLAVAGPSVAVPASGLKYTPPGWELSNRIQNGPNDAVLLWDTLGKRVVDTVTYAGVLHRAVIAGETTEVDATEGAAGAPADNNSAVGSLSRTPNGQDTGQNGADFKFTPTLTPGAPNP